jgi:hypothetical protein
MRHEGVDVFPGERELGPVVDSLDFLGCGAGIG